MKLELTTWPGIWVIVTKESSNTGHLTKGERVGGEAMSIPTVGLRFQAIGGTFTSIDTNIVAKILEYDKDKGGKFETLSGSTYSWVIDKTRVNDYTSKREVEISEEILNKIRLYNGEEHTP